MSDVKKWMIISWRHNDALDAPYGQLLAVIKDTRENAEIAARDWVGDWSPIGIVEEIV